MLAGETCYRIVTIAHVTQSSGGLERGFVLSLRESGKQLWVQSLPSKFSGIGVRHGPSSNILCSQHNYFE